MEILIVVLVVGAALWFFLKRNTRNGADTVQAFVFLRAIKRGASVHDANREASYDVADGPTETIREAIEYVQSAYGGSQLALIKDAKRAGLSPGDKGNGHAELTKRSGTTLRPDHAGKASIPQLSPEMIETGKETIHWCRQEISGYVGRPVETMPDYGLDHDINVGSYICGFLQGQLIENGHLKRWASGDTDLEYLGYYTLAASCLPAVLGQDRALKMVDYLPQIGPGTSTKNIELLDIVGGNAGMAHASGRAKDANVHLRYYFENNIAA